MNELQTIASFQVNHNTLHKGLYLSRVDGDINTYDIRMCVPNGGIYLQNAGLHTFEHLFATYVRSTSYSDRIIYVGPMGCRTGFYFLTRNIPHEEVISLLQETFAFIAGYQGEIPGSTARECGNYLDHDLPQAQSYARDIAAVLAGWTPEQLVYPE